MTAPAEGGDAQREQAFRDWCRRAYDRVFVPTVTEIDAFNAGYVAGQAASVADAREEGTVAGYQAASAECQEAVAEARAEAVEEARQHLRDAFAAGRASERAAIVAWLNKRANGYGSSDPYRAAFSMAARLLQDAADRLAERSHDAAFQQQGEGDRRRP